MGRKTGCGFYQWKDGKAQKGDVDTDGAEQFTDRLILPLLDACVECLRQEVVENEDIVDAAMVFATGFAPFRGGPMHYARSRGIDNVTGSLRQLAQLHGSRFEPDAGWPQMR